MGMGWAEASWAEKDRRNITPMVELVGDPNRKEQKPNEQNEDCAMHVMESKEINGLREKRVQLGRSEDHLVAREQVTKSFESEAL